MAIINQKKTSPTDWLNTSPNLVARHPENLACDIWIAGIARHRSFPALGGSFPRVASSSRTCGSFPRVTPLPAANADDNARVCDLDAALTKVEGKSLTTCSVRFSWNIWRAAACMDYNREQCPSAHLTALIHEFSISVH
jgi:hypothetical protein